MATEQIQSPQTNTHLYDLPVLLQETDFVDALLGLGQVGAEVTVDEQPRLELDKHVRQPRVAVHHGAVELLIQLTVDVMEGLEEGEMVKKNIVHKSYIDNNCVRNKL